MTMEVVRRLAPAAVLALAALTAPAARAEATGGARTSDAQAAIQAVTAAGERTEMQLGELLPQVPEAARPGIEQAIQASRDGRAQAIAALSEASPAHAAGPGDPAAGQPPVEPSVSRVTPVDRARLALSASSERGESALRAAMEHADGAPKDRIRMALDRMRQGAHDALLALHGQHSARPERPDRPQRPEVVGVRPERGAGVPGR